MNNNLIDKNEFSYCEARLIKEMKMAPKSKYSLIQFIRTTIRQIVPLLCLQVLTLALQLNAEPAKDNLMAVEESSAWSIGIGAGVGKRDNLIINSEDIDLNVFVHIAYWGDSVFFDNGDFGYYLSNNPHWNINIIAGVTSERQYFENFNRFKINIDNASADAGGDPVSEENIRQSSEATKRKTPFDAGFEVLGEGSWGSFQLQVNQDISGRHKGFEIWGSYAYPFNITKIRLKPEVGLVYKSDKWSNYFYGVKTNEAIIDSETGQMIRAPYSTNAATNYFFRLAANYPLNDKLKVVALLETEKFDKTIWNSPIVEGKKINTHFIGLFYEF